MVKQTTKKRAVRWALWLLAAFLVFLIASALLPPLERKPVSKEVQMTTAERLNAPPQSTGERILNIEDNVEALVWRLRAIEAAQERIILSTFDFDADSSGWDVISALQNAAQRGVQVQVLMDGFNGIPSWCTGKALRTLAALPNVELKFYNPFHLFQPWKGNYRMHDKYLIVDDFVYILGGRNTNDLFLGDYIGDRANLDRDILVWQPEAQSKTSQTTLEDYFEQVWNLPDTKLMGKGKKPSETMVKKLEDHYKELHQRYPEAFGPVDWQEQTYAVNSIDLWTNPIESECKAPELWYALVEKMKEGQDILVQTPYIVLDDPMYEDLTSLNQDGRSVHILTNAVANGANPFGCSDFMRSAQKIRDTGSKIYELYTDRSAHTKAILVDDRWCLLGTFNMDMRSTYLATELMLFIDSPELNARLRAQLEELKTQSVLTLSDGSQQVGENCHPQPIGIWKKLAYRLMQLIGIPIRHLL